MSSYVTVMYSSPKVLKTEYRLYGLSDVRQTLTTLIKVYSYFKTVSIVGEIQFYDVLIGIVLSGVPLEFPSSSPSHHYLTTYNLHSNFSI